MASKVIIIRKTAYGEWRVNPLGGAEATAYYATDIDDAIYTAFAEWGTDIKIHAPANVLKEYKRICEEKGYVCKSI